MARRTKSATVFYLCHACGQLLEVPTDHSAEIERHPGAVVHCHPCALRFIHES